MPYCPKCGVEVEYKIEKCPLCKFQIPDIEIEIEHEEVLDRFPEVKNIYPKLAKEFKRNAFIILSVVTFANIFILLYNNYMIVGNLTWSKYSSVVFLSMWINLIFIFRYVKSISMSIIGVTLNTLFLLAGLDFINGRMEWFVQLGLPAVIMLFVVILISYFMWIKSKNRGAHSAAFTLFLICAYSIGLEFFINMHLYDRVFLLWSISTSLILLPFGLLLLYIHYQLPTRIKEEIRKRFHI